MLVRVTVSIERKTGNEISRDIEPLPDEIDNVYERLAEILAPRIINTLEREEVM